MSLENVLKDRSQNECELCKNTEELKIYEVPPNAQLNERDCIYLCANCRAQIDKKEMLNPKHWECLKDSMWSEVPAVQVVSWRMLNRLKQESWANDLLDMMYLDDELLEFAKKSGDHENSADVVLHTDCNGAILQHGDTVVLTKSLDVKGSTLNARLGTVVKNIRLVEDNTDQIEGKIEGQTIVILTKYVRKQN